jgi:hypothetical protein
MKPQATNILHSRGNNKQNEIAASEMEKHI